MNVDLQQIVNSPYGVQLVSKIGQGLPVRAGHVLADLAARFVASRRSSKIVKAVRANQWVVSGETLSGKELDQAVRETFRNSARSIFDLYHYVHNLEAVGKLVVLDEPARRLIQRPELDERGLVVVGIHLSNFDLVLQWICTQGIKPLILTIPDLKGGRQKEYEMRKKTGMNLVPASLGALRQGVRYLQQGGIVATGIDRPIPFPEVRPNFFGRPASLPIHHIFLATKARVPIMLMAPLLQSDGKYHVLSSELIEMDPHPDREKEGIQNAEKVLTIAEGFIKRAPQQWSISLPVWKEALDEMPQ